MIYTNLTKKAMRIAYARHHGQKDKAGLPYIFHPYHLAEQMGDDEYAVCARKVKMADLRHNLDATRLPPARTEDERIRDKKRCEKYRQALAFLES